MDILLLALSIGLPLIKFLLFPARTMGRGGGWTLVGALMIVGLMMALWFGVQSLTDTAGMLSGPAVAKAGHFDQPKVPDLDTLARSL